MVCFRERRIDLDDRTKPGTSMLKVWIEIFHPTESDKGKYTLEMFDGVDTHKRSLDLAGQGNEPRRGIWLMSPQKTTGRATINITAITGTHIFKTLIFSPCLSFLLKHLMMPCWNTRD